MLLTGENKVVGRYAPTPSGKLHIGNAFSFLISYLDVAQQGGFMRLRIEDLDKVRCKPELINTMFKDLEWLDLPWEGDVIYQSKRYEAYSDAFLSLERQDLVYPCFCSRADLHAASAPHTGEEIIYPGTCRRLSNSDRVALLTKKTPSYRIKVPGKTFSFSDTYQDDCSFSLLDICGDFVVRRADKVFAYQLAVVVDDAAMNITTVTRGCDLLSSAPRQMYLQQCLGLPSVKYAHIPLIVDENGRRLSKRSGDISIEHFRSDTSMTSSEFWGKLAFDCGLVDELQLFSLKELSRVANTSILKRKKQIVISHIL